MPRNDLIQYRRSTASEWATANPVLYSGEIGYDTTNNQIRVGDGVTPWSGLTPLGYDTVAMAEKANVADVYDKITSDARYATVAQGAKADAAIPSAQKGIASGVATLDGSVKVPAGQIPMQAIADSSELNTTIAEGVVTGVRTVRRTGPTVFLGDSNFQINTNNATRTYGFSVPSLVSILSQGKLGLARNAGVASDTSAMMLARIEADVLAYKPGRVFLQAGSNDVTKGAAHFADARIAYRAIIERCLAEGIEIFLGTIPPRGAQLTGALRSNGNVYRLTLMWNTFIRQTATEYKLPLVDTYAAVVDPLTGNWKDGYSDDMVHWIGPGVLAAATYIWAQLEPYYRADLIPVERDPYSVLNFCQDPTMQGGLVAGSGRFPLGFNGADSSVMTTSLAEPVGDDGLTAGRWFKGAMFGSTAANINMIRTRDSFISASGIPVADGDLIALGFRFKVENLTGVTADAYTSFSILFRDAGGATVKQITPASQYRYMVKGFVYVEDTWPVNAVDVRLNWSKSVGAATADIYIGQVSIYDLTAMGISSLLVGEVESLLSIPAFADLPNAPEPDPTPVIWGSDSFNRADTAAGTLGTMDDALGGSGARVWAGASQVQIIGNQVAGTTSTTRYPSVDSGLTDVGAEVTLGGDITGGVFIGSALTGGISNLSYIADSTATGVVRLIKIDSAGASQVISASATGLSTPGARLKVRRRAGAISVFLDGTLVHGPYTAPEAAAGTRVGMKSGTSGSFALDQFIGTDL